MQLLKMGAAVLMFGMSAFIFSTGWHSGMIVNWAGQTCYFDLCFRPEWVGLGAAGTLVSIILITLNFRTILYSPLPGPTFSPANRVLRLPRINSTSAVLFGLAVAGTAGVALTNYGVSVSGTATRPGKCAAETPVEIAVRNNTFQAVSGVQVAVEIMPLSGVMTTTKSILRVEGPIAPFSAGSACFSTELKAPTEAAFASGGSLRQNISAAFDRVDGAIKFGQDHRVEVHLLRAE